MDIDNFGYAAVVYVSDENKDMAFFETSKGYLMSHTLSLFSSILRQSLLKPKLRSAKIELSEGQVKIVLDPGFGSKTEVMFKDVSNDFKMDSGSIFKRM